MTEAPSPYDKFGLQFAWDSTSLKRAATCLRLYQYESIEGWQSPFKSVHLWFGGHYATALEHYYVHRAAGKDREEAIRLIVREALENTWDKEKAAPMRFDSAEKTRETLIRTIVWYFEQFVDDNFSTYITSEGIPAVEHSFRLPVDNDLIFCGHIDRLAVDPMDELFVHDQKTTKSALSPQYFRNFDLDIQMSIYTFAGKMIYNVPVKGVIVDAAQVLVGSTRYDRSPTLRTDGHLNEWYDETMKTIEVARNAQKENFFPRNTNACGNFGGCPFRHVCSRSPSLREPFLKADFVKGKIWNPLEQR